MFLTVPASHIIIFLTGVVLSSFSQILLKKSAISSHQRLRSEYFNIRVISAYCFFVIATLLSIIAYQKMALKYGTVLHSTGYIFAMFFEKFFLNEPLKSQKLVGAGLIVVGVAIFAT